MSTMQLQRAEHNEGLVSTLEEVALHQQNIEKIEALGQLCPRLKIIYLQSNLISKIQNLHKLKALQYINLAVNNITKIQNLQKCESLEKIDLTMNFVDKAGLLTVESLGANDQLKEVYLMGNPCADWPGYREYVIAKLPKLQKLDGQAIKHSERIAAAQKLPTLEKQLRDELIAAGLDPDTAAFVEDDSMYDENGEIAETGYLDENGEMRRPWCAATRILEHRENDGERIFQKNEGQWEFSIEEDEQGKNLVLEVEVGKHLDTSLIKVDVQPLLVRLLIKGRLLQLQLPCEVRTDASTAQRSAASGKLQITMPKENAAQVVHDVAHVRPAKDGSKSKTVSGTGVASSGGAAMGKPSVSSLSAKGDFLLKEVRKAAVVAAEVDDEDFVPDL